jgi:hypothetical protein
MCEDDVSLLSLINNITESKLNTTYLDFKSSIEKLGYSVREDDDLVIINKNEESCMFDKIKMRPICLKLSNTIYNANALKELQEMNWKEAIVQVAYEGISVNVFKHNNTWRITTWKSNDNNSELINKKVTCKELFDEIISDKFNLDDLNPNYCYNFVLIHHKNKNIINYANFGSEFRELVHISTVEKYTLIDAYNCNIIGVLRNQPMYFSCFDELETNLEKNSCENTINKRLTLEGYQIRVNISNGVYKTYKLQTEIYQKLLKIKLQNDNTYQTFLELYQTDKLHDILPFFTKYSNEVTYRINMSMRTLSREILNIYHATRNKQHTEIYELLTEQYKKILYDIHGIYINNRKKDFINGRELEENESKSITVHDIYYHIKSLPFVQLKKIYMDRQILLKSELLQKHLCKDCIFSLTHTKLMFG